MAHPYDRPTGGPEDRPPNSDVVAESFPLLGRTWPFLYPSAPSALPPSLRFRPSVRHKAGWTLASIVISTEGPTDGMDGRREGGGEGGWGHFGNGRTATGALDATLLITKLPTLANMGNVAVVCKAGVTGGGRGRAASSPPSLPPSAVDIESLSVGSISNERASERASERATENDHSSPLPALHC